MKCINLYNYILNIYSKRFITIGNTSSTVFTNRQKRNKSINKKTNISYFNNDKTSENSQKFLKSSYANNTNKLPDYMKIIQEKNIEINRLKKEIEKIKNKIYSNEEINNDNKNNDNNDNNNKNNVYHNKKEKSKNQSGQISIKKISITSCKEYIKKNSYIDDLLKYSENFIDNKEMNSSVNEIKNISSDNLKYSPSNRNTLKSVNIVNIDKYKTNEIKSSKNSKDTKKEIIMINKKEDNLNIKEKLNSIKNKTEKLLIKLFG